MKRITLLAALMTAIGSPLASGADWPRWLGPEGTGISTETGLAESWPADGPKKIWTQTVGIGYSSPVAVNGKIYLFWEDDKDDVLGAFDADSGSPVWKQSSPRDKTYSYPGTRATPTIVGDRIYTHGSNGDLVARQLSDGKQIWHVNTLTESGGKPIEWGQASSPFVDGELIYVQGGTGGATALAVNRETGKVAWKSQATALAGYATAIVVDVGGAKQVIIFGGDAVHALDPKTGKTLWTEAWKTDYDVNAATPLYRAPNLMVTSTRNPGAMMLTLSTDGVKRLWEKKSITSKFQPPLLDGDTIYVNSGGVLTAAAWPSGETLWTAKGRDYNLGAGGSLVRVGDKLITMSERGRLSLIQANPKEYKLISQVALFDYPQVWSTPLIYKGKLYAKGKDDLVCLDISKP